MRIREYLSFLILGLARGAWVPTRQAISALQDGDDEAPTLGYDSEDTTSVEVATTLGYDLIWTPSNPKGSFLLNYTNFNHGSFGATPRSVLDYQTQLRRQQCAVVRCYNSLLNVKQRLYISVEV